MPHPNSRTNRGTRRDILNNLTTVLNTDHDVIQWLFPNQDPSKSQPSSPYLRDHIEIKWLREHKAETQAIAANVDENLSQLAKYWGLAESKDGSQFVVSTAHGKALWAKDSDHNFNRLTRVLASLVVFGLRDRALALYNAINDYRTSIGKSGNVSDEYWRDVLGL